MKKTATLNKLLATTVFCGALGLAAPAYAQDQKQETQPQTGPVEAANPNTSSNANTEAADNGTIVITGSRIPQPNLTAVSPVTVVNSQEVRLSGTTRTEDLLNSLPQVFAGQGGNLSNGATGTATVDLRGLAPRRTLVLVNGRRLLPGDPFDSAADINAIPATVVDRVDVLTGGASSVYGADAVAGVVNFVMNTNFTGIRLDSQYSFFQHDNNEQVLVPGLNARGFGYPHGSVADGGTTDLSAQIGASFDDGRGHVVAYATYRKLQPILQSKRDYSACGTSTNTANTNVACGGSATSANGTVIAFTGTPSADPKKNTFTSTFFQVGPNRTLLPGFTPYNFNPTNYYQRPDERYTFGAFANYEISPALRPYMEAMFMDDHTVAQIAPSGDFGNTLTVNCDNPLLGAQQRAILCAPNNLISTSGDVVGATITAAHPIANPPQVFIDQNGNPYFRGAAQILRRNVEGGGRVSDLQHTSFRLVTGMRGDLGKAWSYDAYYQFGQVNYAQTYLNDFSVVRLTRALDIINVAGTPTCRSVVDGSDPNCVPYDVFGNNITPAALNYLQTPGFARGTTKESIASASLTGRLGEYGVQLPWAENGVGLALGAEYRKEQLQLQTDVEFQTGDLSGQGGATLPIRGAYDVREVFGEIRVPIVEHGIFDNLSIEAGYRHSKYQLLEGVNRSFSTDTWKIGGDFAPVRDLRLRASYNRAVRAPNIQELFASQNVQLNGTTDPCAGHTILASETGCILSGLAAGRQTPQNAAAQYNGLVGGNPNLRPEIATTKSFGVVLQPRFVPRFALTVDWFDIKVKDAIRQIGQDTILQQCVQTASPTFCSLVHRDQFGSIWRTPAGFVQDTTQNIGAVSTRGIDVGASYSMNIGSWGGLSANFVGTWLDKLITDTGVSTPFDCTGYYGTQCGTPNPAWRHKLRLTWNAPDGIGISVQWRYFGSVQEDRQSTQTSLKGKAANISPFNARIPAQSYFDLAFTARVGDHYRFRLGVNNLLDKAPPLIGANGGTSACPAVFCSGNTFPNVYDAMGRYIFAGVTLDF